LTGIVGKNYNTERNRIKKRTAMLKRIFIVFAVFLMTAPAGFSYWEWTPKTGRWINPKLAVKDTPKEQFELAEQFRKDGQTEKAIREYEKLVKHYSSSEYAAPSCFALGEIYQQLGNSKESFDNYQKIVDNYPQSPLVLEAIKRQSAIAENALERHSFRLLGPRKVEKGDMLATVIESQPYSDDSALKAFKLGRFYLDIKEYEKAREVFTTAADRYTDPQTVEEARFYIIKTDFSSIPAVSTDIKNYSEIDAKIKTFLSLYPDSRYRDEVVGIRSKLAEKEAKKYYEIATYYERSGKTDSAKYYYKIIAENYPETDYGKISAKKINTAR